MDKVLEIIQQIESTSSRNEKENILRQNKDNILLRDILYFIYNPYILTGISNKKLNKKLGLPIITKPLTDVNDLMTYLRNYTTGTDHNVQVVQDFLNRNRKSELDSLYRQIITKNLKIGITATTINKIFGKGFIPEFNVMLAEKYFDYEDDLNEDNLNEDLIATLKLDGNRNVAMNYDDGVKMFTRQGLPNEGFVDIENEIFKYLPKGFAYDGEFIAKNNNNLNSADLYRETTSKVRKDGIKKNIDFHIFDMIPIEDFKSGYCPIPYHERKKRLTDLYIRSCDDIHLKEVPILYRGRDKTKIIELLNKVTSEGLEGLMINLANAPYECKRSRGLLKVKKFNDADVRVLDVIEGDGKNKGKLGAIKCQFYGKDNSLQTSNIGSGFSEEERILYFKNPELLLNKIVTVGYFEISNNKDGGQGLRFGTWKGIIRDDKDEISMY